MSRDIVSHFVTLCDHKQQLKSRQLSPDGLRPLLDGEVSLDLGSFGQNIQNQKSSLGPVDQNIPKSKIKPGSG